MSAQGGVRRTRFLRGQHRCKRVEFDRNMIPWDSGQTTIVKSAALMCMDPIYMQRIYPNGHFNSAYFMVFTPTKMALHCPFHLQSSRKTRRTWPMRLEGMYEALAATTSPVFETNCASAWPWALGRPAVSAQGGVRRTRFLSGQNRCKWVEFDRNMIPWDSEQTTIVKSAAPMCMDPIYMQRIYPNGQVMCPCFMVFALTKMALHRPFHLQSSRKRVERGP